MKELIKSKYASFKQNDFIKGAATLATGTAISQVIPFLISPLVSRLYDPIDYSILAAYTSVTIILTIISTGMYDSAMMIDKEDKNALNTGVVAVCITAVITILSFIGVLLLKDRIIKSYGSSELGIWLYMVPMTVFFHGTYQTLNVWNNRKCRYKRLATNRVIMTSITTTLTLGLGFLDLHGKGLILSLILGQVASFLILFFQTLRSDGALIPLINKREVIQSFKTHSDFPKYNLPQGFFDGLKESGLIWIISAFFGNAALGSFSFARSIILRPLQVIGSSVGQVFYQQASKIHNSAGNITNLTKKTFLNLLFLGLPFAVLIFLFGDEIFAFIFGNEWAEAGHFAQILVFWLLLSFIGSAISSIPLILQKQKMFFAVSLTMNSLPLILLYEFAQYGFTMFTSLGVYSALNFLSYIFLFAWFWYLLTLHSKYSQKPAY